MRRSGTWVRLAEYLCIPFSTCVAGIPSASTPESVAGLVCSDGGLSPPLLQCFLIISHHVTPSPSSARNTNHPFSVISRPLTNLDIAAPILPVLKALDVTIIIPSRGALTLKTGAPAVNSIDLKHPISSIFNPAAPLPIPEPTSVYTAIAQGSCLPQAYIQRPIDFCRTYLHFHSIRTIAITQHCQRIQRLHRAAR